MLQELIEHFRPARTDVPVPGSADDLPGMSPVEFGDFLTAIQANEAHMSQVPIPCRRPRAKDHGTQILYASLSKALVVPTADVAALFDEFGPSNLLRINKDADAITRQTGVRLHFDSDAYTLSFTNDQAAYRLNLRSVPSSNMYTWDVEYDQQLVVKGLMLTGLDPEIAGHGIVVTDLKSPGRTALALPGSLVVRYFPYDTDGRQLQPTDLSMIDTDTVKDEQLIRVQEMLNDPEVTPVGVLFLSPTPGSQEINTDLKPVVRCGACDQVYPATFTFRFQGEKLVGASATECPHCGYANPFLAPAEHRESDR